MLHNPEEVICSLEEQLNQYKNFLYCLIKSFGNVVFLDKEDLESITDDCTISIIEDKSTDRYILVGTKKIKGD